MKQKFNLYARLLFSAIMTLGIFSSCAETEEALENIDPPALSISTITLSFDADGVSADSYAGSVDITTDNDWNITVDDDDALTSWGWSISSTSGSGDSSVTIAASPAVEAHSAKFTVTAYSSSGEKVSKEITVSQDGPFLIVSVDDDTPSCYDTQLKLQVESHGAWALSSDKSWIIPSEVSGNATDGTATEVDIIIEANFGDERSATLTFTNECLTKKIVITQSKYIDQIAEIVSFDVNMPGYGLINQDISISAYDSWSITSDESWITFSQDSGEACLDEPTVIKLNSEINFYGDRTATITITAGEITTIYNISQPIYEHPTTTYRVGDPGIQFDESQYDPSYTYYDQMMIWKTAGVQDGIPYLADQMTKITKTFEPGATSTEINDYFYDNRTKEIYVLLKNGDYTFDSTVRLYSNAVLIGESRDGVKITVDPSIGSSSPITLYAASNAGVRNLWVHGGWLNEDGENYPKYSYREATVVQELTDEGMDGHIMINVKSSSAESVSNCYVDNVKITNSASHPVVIKGQHITLRDLDIDASFNKDGGCQGYMYLGGSLSLITGCKVTNIRHISMQGSEVKQNVFYDNDIMQEVSFHNSDGGDNLISYNRIYLHEDLFEGYNAIMGPWSSSHDVGGLNFIYLNRCKEDNGDRGGATPWSDDQLYLGPYEVSIGSSNPTRYTNFRAVDSSDFPAGGSLYPVILD